MAVARIEDRVRDITDFTAEATAFEFARHAEL
jgi:hypothetical protein